jgi:hypothetical protein
MSVPPSQGQVIHGHAEVVRRLASMWHQALASPPQAQSSAKAHAVQGKGGCASNDRRRLLMEGQMIERLFWITNSAVMVAVVALGGVAIGYVAGLI